jgi:hypothetical protein
LEPDIAAPPFAHKGDGGILNTEAEIEKQAVGVPAGKGGKCYTKAVDNINEQAQPLQSVYNLRVCLAHEPSMSENHEFGRLLTAVCDASAKVPPASKGRIDWLVEEFDRRWPEGRRKPAHRAGKSGAAESQHTVSPATVSKWLSGEAMPQDDNLKRLAELLEMPVNFTCCTFVSVTRIEPGSQGRTTVSWFAPESPAHCG